MCENNDFLNCSSVYLWFFKTQSCAILLIKTGIIIGSCCIVERYSFLKRSKAKSFDYFTSSTVLSLVKSLAAYPIGCSILMPRLKSSIWIEGSCIKNYCDLSNISGEMDNSSKSMRELCSNAFSSSLTVFCSAAKYFLWSSQKWIILSS